MVLQEIFIYPIKSLGGIKLDSWHLEEKGFRYDRRWMLVDKSGMFLSQRKHPKMALLQVKLSDEGLIVSQKQQNEQKLLIPYEHRTLGSRAVTIWDDIVDATFVGEQYSAWFSEQLGIECDLVVMPEHVKRKVNPKYAVAEEAVSFADGMPYLLIGEASLEELNQRLDKPVGMDRFRPNLVIKGASPFEEDNWSEIAIGEAVFKITKPCARCVMTTVDQDTAEKGKEPLKTLAAYRTVNGKVMFGQNMSLWSGSKVSVGDEVIVKK
jgi:uncharacterized protein